MKCFKDKTIFNLFEYSSCEGCACFIEDKIITIGEVRINLYYIHEGCNQLLFKNDYYYHLEIFLSKKLKLFLKDIIINKIKNNNLFFLWLDNFDLNNEFNMNILYDLLEFEEDIYIIS